MKRVLPMMILLGLAGCSSGPEPLETDRIARDLAGQAVQAELSQRQGVWRPVSSEIKNFSILKRFSDKKAGTDEVHAEITLENSTRSASGTLVLGYKRFEQVWRLEMVSGLIKGNGSWYTSAGYETTTDDSTSLMWAKDGASKGCYFGNSLSWKEAIMYCANLDYAGYSDWRLPTKTELSTLILAGNSPTIDTAAFPNTKPAWYWTSEGPNTTIAWIVGFDTGLVQTGVLDGNYRDGMGPYIRCVRSTR